MKAVAQIVNPEQAQMSLTLTMTVKEWKEFAGVLPNAWPGWPVASLIRQSIEGTIAHVETAQESTA
jgi:hypothetical protein